MKRSPRDDLQADEPDKKKLPVGSVDGDTSLGGGDNPLVIHEEDEEESNDSASFRKFHANLNPSPLSTTPTSSAGLATSPFFPVYIFLKIPYWEEHYSLSFLPANPLFSVSDP